ncbi:hypothetical protein [Qipengyuania sediminis]|uniref:hypothetical protein n=1 Tax=Qipengyuania sediminis TaxID=1532023 RepID=UPI0010592498|nr:hypothetical protein [Qipengyuania sediminis]
MRRFLPLTLLLLAACGERESGTDGSESDFASRVGTASTQASSAIETAAAIPSKAVKGPPPEGANIFAPEKLGDIGGVNLGPRAGGCTFVANGTELLIAAAPADRALPGKGVVRIGGKLIELDTPPGGIEAVKAGTSFRGEGFTVAVRPTGPGKGTMTITNGAGQSKATAGDYVCA